MRHASRGAVRSPFPSFTVAGTRTPAPYGMTLGLALFWFLALRWFHGRTLTGLAISASAENRFGR